MSTAWVIGLGLAAGYLINKNLQVSGLIDKAQQNYNNSAAPSTDGATSSEVRAAWANTDFVKYGDMQEDMPKSQKDLLVARTEQQRQTIESYETPPGSVREIQGVLLTYDRFS